MDQGIYTFAKGIHPKVKVIIRLNPAYLHLVRRKKRYVGRCIGWSTVSYVSHYALFAPYGHFARLTTLHNALIKQPHLHNTRQYFTGWANLAECLRLVGYTHSALNTSWNCLPGVLCYMLAAFCRYRWELEVIITTVVLSPMSAMSIMNNHRMKKEKHKGANCLKR